MNNSFLAIIKRIVAEQGENILSDSVRLKPFIKSYASAEPKEDRVAFGRAIENGFYYELKRTSPSNRAQVKASQVSRLQTLTGYDARRCSETVNLLEAVLPQTVPPPYVAPMPPPYTPQSSPVVQPYPHTNTPVKKKSGALKWILIAAGIVIVVWYFFIYEGGSSTQSAPVRYYYANQDGSPDWETFYNDIRATAPNYNYIFVRSESTDVYHEHALNRNGNVFYYHEDGRNYQLILRNNDYNYFGTVKRFNGTQADAAISYFNDQLPNILRDFIEGLLWWSLF